MKPGLAIGQATSNTALAFGRVWAVEERNVLISDIAEPDNVRADGPVEPSHAYQWTLLESSNRPRAMLWTGASPHRS